MSADTDSWLKVRTHCARCPNSPGRAAGCSGSNAVDALSSLGQQRPPGKGNSCACWCRFGRDAGWLDSPVQTARDHGGSGLSAEGKLIGDRRTESLHPQSYVCGHGWIADCPCDLSQLGACDASSCRVRRCHRQASDPCRGGCSAQPVRRAVRTVLRVSPALAGQPLVECPPIGQLALGFPRFAPHRRRKPGESKGQCGANCGYCDV